mmetsp:Transcript_68/g.168  ORF Transcript_68/g.168 Transcript_68/m.168 type:complete len:225 (+) Transcript_68:1663-2337(+)
MLTNAVGQTIPERLFLKKRGPVNLVHIHLLGPQFVQRGFQRVHYALPRKPERQRRKLCRDVDVALKGGRPLRRLVLPRKAAAQPLRLAGTVHFRGIKKIHLPIHARVESRLQGLILLGLVPPKQAVSPRPSADAKRRDGERAEGGGIGAESHPFRGVFHRVRRGVLRIRRGCLDVLPVFGRGGGGYGKRGGARGAGGGGAERGEHRARRAGEGEHRVGQRNEGH